jgi:hypothetical protein
METLAETRTWRLGVVLFLPAKQRFDVFNATEYEDDHRPDGADDEHAFEKSRQNRDEYMTHREIRLFQTKHDDRCQAIMSGDQCQTINVR